MFKLKNTVCLKYNYRHKFRFLHTGTFSAMSKAVLSLSKSDVLQDKGAVLNGSLEFHLTFANAGAELKRTDWATDSFLFILINY
jgi:hypothetical protein